MQGPCWISLRVLKFFLAKVVLFNHTCILDSLHCFHHSDTFAIYINLQSTSHWIFLHPTPPTTFWGIMLSCSVISRVLYSKQDFAHIWTTRSCAALRAADLGLSGQDAFAQWHSFDPKNVTWQTQIFEERQKQLVAIHDRERCLSHRTCVRCQCCLSRLSMHCFLF